MHSQKFWSDDRRDHTFNLRSPCGTLNCLPRIIRRNIRIQIAGGHGHFDRPWGDPCGITRLQNIGAGIVEFCVRIEKDTEEPLDAILGAFVLIKVSQTAYKPISRHMGILRIVLRKHANKLRAEFLQRGRAVPIFQQTTRFI